MTLSISAQSKKVKTGINNTSRLERIVFGTKDSAALDNMFAKTISFSWLDAKAASRNELIEMIINNRSSYLELLSTEPYGVKEVGDSVIVDHLYSTKEIKPEGVEAIRSFFIEAVWAKEANQWKLFRCRIVNYQ